jgi:hypothetical protein
MCPSYVPAGHARQRDQQKTSAANVVTFKATTSRKAACPSNEFDEAQRRMQSGEGELLGCRSSQFVLGAKPLSQPLASRSFYSSIGFADWSKTERVSPPNHHTVECRYHGFLGQKGLVPSGFLADDLTDALHRFFDGGGRSAMVVPTAIDSHSRSVPIRESCRPLPSFCKQGVVRGHAMGKADLEPEKSTHTNYGFRP